MEQHDLQSTEERKTKGRKPKSYYMERKLESLKEGEIMCKTCMRVHLGPTKTCAICLEAAKKKMKIRNKKAKAIKCLEYLLEYGPVTIGEDVFSITKLK